MTLPDHLGDRRKTRLKKTRENTYTSTHAKEGAVDALEVTRRLVHNVIFKLRVEDALVGKLGGDDLINVARSKDLRNQCVILADTLRGECSLMRNVR